MREIARLAAFLVALVVLGRNLAIGGGAPAVATSAGIALLFVFAALTLWRDGAITLSAVALAGQYLHALVIGDVVIDLGAPFVGALLLVYLDLADLATALPRDRRVDTALVVASARRTAAVLAVALVAGIASFAVAAVPWPGGELLRAAGALGVAAVVIVPLILLRRT